MVLRYGAGAGLSTMQSPNSICERPDMTDPLSEVITLLQPRAVFSRRISGAGRWEFATPPSASPASALYWMAAVV
jgi:hypothetical protein